MEILSIISTKGGEGKTSVAANLGGFLADAGLRVLLVDMDPQPTLSSYFTVARRAEGGVYELLACNEHRVERVISNTCIPNLDLIVSNDERGQLGTLLLHAADGRLRLRNLLTLFERDYDVMLIDNQGARSVLLEMSVLASTVVVTPVTSEILAARELRRGTVQLIEDVAPFRHLGIAIPMFRLLLNRVHAVSSNARLIRHALSEVFSSTPGITLLRTSIPALEAYPSAAMQGLPVHRVERRKPRVRVAPSALETMGALACELFPQWAARFVRVTGTVREEIEPHG